MHHSSYILTLLYMCKAKIHPGREMLSLHALHASYLHALHASYLHALHANYLHALHTNYLHALHANSLHALHATKGLWIAQKSSYLSTCFA